MHSVLFPTPPFWFAKTIFLFFIVYIFIFLLPCLFLCLSIYTFKYLYFHFHIYVFAYLNIYIFIYSSIYAFCHLCFSYRQINASWLPLPHSLLCDVRRFMCEERIFFGFRLSNSFFKPFKCYFVSFHQQLWQLKKHHIDINLYHYCFLYSKSAYIIIALYLKTLSFCQLSPTPWPFISAIFLVF